MATKGKPQGSSGGNLNRSRNAGGRGVSGGSDVGYPSAQGEPIMVAVGLAICLMLLAGFVTLTAFMYADLQAARGANKMIEKKMQRVIERCDRE